MDKIWIGTEEIRVFLGRNRGIEIGMNMFSLKERYQTNLASVKYSLIFKNRETIKKVDWDNTAEGFEYQGNVYELFYSKGNERTIEDSW